VRVIICAVLAALPSVSAPLPPTRKLERFAAGAQIITGGLIVDRFDSRRGRRAESDPQEKQSQQRLPFTAEDSAATRRIASA
jgi:hypothetical protein